MWSAGSEKSTRVSYDGIAYQFNANEKTKEIELTGHKEKDKIKDITYDPEKAMFTFSIESVPDHQFSYNIRRNSLASIYPKEEDNRYSKIMCYAPESEEEYKAIRCTEAERKDFY